MSLPAVAAPPGQHKWEWPLVAGRARSGVWHPHIQQWRRWRCRNKRSQRGKVVFQLSPNAGCHKLCRRIILGYYGVAWSCLRHLEYVMVDWISNPISQIYKSFCSVEIKFLIRTSFQILILMLIHLDYSMSYILWILEVLKMFRCPTDTIVGAQKVAFCDNIKSLL